ncbi:MAG: GTPase, partial [Candidatus Nanohaloarchaea archaeon]
MGERNAVILGAAGRDYHDFNIFFRGNDDYTVKAFLQVGGQNLGEAGEAPERRYPSSIAGEKYPEGIPILPESRFEQVVEEEDVDEVVLSYSDISHEHVMHQASRALAKGCSFRLLGPGDVQIESRNPVVAVDAVRTGCGKSQASQKIADILQGEGFKVAVVREPMPYGDLEEQRVQQFESLEDVDEAGVTIEEREEYERHVEKGHTVFSGVDYQEILEMVEEESEIVIWEGGNNEIPFFEPDVHFVLADPHRAGDEISYHPGETNLRTADYIVINKENTAEQEGIDEVVRNAEEYNPDADTIHAESVVTVENPEGLEGSKVIVVEDGPTVTHGGAK